jgi:6-phosphogluconolactonase
MGWVNGHASGVMEIESGEVQELAVIANPSFLAAHPTLPVVYALTELPYGLVTAIHLDRGADRARVGTSVATGGGGPCHLAVSLDGSYLVVANTRSSVISFGLRKDGSIGMVKSLVHPPGPATASVMPRQEMPHPHMVAFDPETGDVLVPDLGMDAVLLHGFVAGELQLRSIVAFPPGAGPRHLAFHPAGTHAYVVEELAGAIGVMRRNSQGGWDRLSNGPAAGLGWTLGAPSTLVMSGDRLFVADRAHNAIAVYSIVDRDAPAFVKSFDCGGITPRDIALSSDGTSLFVANQDSDTVVEFDLSTAGERQVRIYSVPSPACVLSFPAWSQPSSSPQKVSKSSRK